jgi:hypothetical protein
MFNKYGKTKKAITTVVAFATVALFTASNASVAFAKMEMDARMTVPINTQMNYHNIMSNMKDFILDKAATSIAKQVLSRITASVVNWINSGFHGSPSFLTDPGSFFLDVADQVTGAFLDQSGPLKQMCEPFSIDLRASLAWDQAGGSYRRYKCTLNTIIKNASKSGISVNGMSMNGFLGGDFRQGGWSAFLAMTEPQNSYNGAYLMAYDDMNSRIESRKQTYEKNLSMGSGFLSLEQCDPVSPGQVYNDANLGEPAQVPVTPSDSGNQFSAGTLSLDQTSATTQVAADGSLQAKNNTTGFNNNTGKFEAGSKGLSSYKPQNCHATTPGALVSQKLFKNANSGEMQLELANSINSVIDALISQLTNQLMSQGLKALSGGGSSSGGVSYAQQIINNTTAMNEANTVDIQNRANQSTTQLVQPIQDYRDTYGQIITPVTDTSGRYSVLRTCFADKLAALPATTTNTFSNMLAVELLQAQKNYANTQIAKIDSVLADLGLILTNVNANMTKASADIQSAMDASVLSKSKSLDQVNTYEASSANTISTSLRYTNMLNDAATDVQIVKDKITILNQDAIQYQSSCAGFPGNVRLLSKQGGL